MNMDKGEWHELHEWLCLNFPADTAPCQISQHRLDMLDMARTAWTSGGLGLMDVSLDDSPREKSGRGPHIRFQKSQAG